MMAKLLILSFSPIASDARVLKQVNLFAGQYELYTCGYGPPPVGVHHHYEIPEHLPVWRWDRRALITRRYRTAYWRNAAIAFAAAMLPVGEFDAVLANDADSVGLALSLKARRGVHVDLHEYAPRQKEEVRRWRLFVAPFVRWMCRTFVARAASVTTVGAEIATEYTRRFGFRPAVVINAAPYADLSPQPVSAPIRLVHSGAGLRNRGLMLMVDAVAATSAPVTFDLYLTPNDPGYLAELAARVATIDGVTVHPPVPYSRLIATLNDYDVGLFVLPPVNFNYRWALPNKLFDFVQGRLGIVIGPSPEMARIVRERGLGDVSADFTAASLTSILDGLTPELIAQWKEASDGAARALAAENQTEGWDRAIRQLLTS